VKQFPRVYFELTDRCNLSCAFCAGAHGTREMEKDSLDAVIRRIADVTDEIRPHVLGEPLIYPHFAYFMSLCETYGVSVKITTNGLAVSENRNILLESPVLREINFSLHSFTESTHGSPETYLSPILSLCDEFTARNTPVHINFRFWNMSDNVLPDTRRLFSILTDHYKSDTPDSRGNDIPDGGKSSVKLTLRRRISFDEQFEWPSLSRPVIRKHGFCHGTRSHIAILSDGTVVPCCLDARGNIPLGNIHSAPLAEIIRSPRFLAIKEGFSRRELTEDLCRRCSYINRFD